MINYLREFFKLEAAGSMLLLFAALLAMAIENSSASAAYGGFLGLPVIVQVGTFYLAKPLLLWINDGLMAIFFLLVGLELKREVLGGELSSFDRMLLPCIAAVGGMAVPAGIYCLLNYTNPTALHGWAIPSATDIAFAVGVLSVFGSRVPTSLKILLLAIAIVDDLGAIIIIALFYSHEVSLGSLAIAVPCLLALFYLNRRGVRALTPFMLVGFVLWVAVLKSGVHATLAGVILAFFIPHRREPGRDESTMLEKLEHDLHPSVAYGILPLFAFANGGVSFAGVGLGTLVEPVTLGIALGLFLGKAIGVGLTTWLAVSLGLVAMPRDATWGQILGVALLCGIGFTMSLFIGSLAFEATAEAFAVPVRLGIIGGSILSALGGYLVLQRALPKAAA